MCEKYHRQPLFISGKVSPLITQDIGNEMAKIVFADTQTYRERDYHVVRINDVRDDSVELRFQEIGGFDGTHEPEIIGYVAFDQDTTLFSTELVNADHTMTDLENIEVNNGNTQPIFADMQTRYGGDPTMVSLGMGDTPTSGKVYIDEETRGDSEVAHVSERVAVAQFNVATTRTISETSAPTISNWDGDVIGGALAHWVHNSVIYDGSRFTVSLQDYFGDDFDMENMVVIVGPTQRDDLNFKIVSVDNDAETVVIEVQDFGSYTPPPTGVHGVNLGLLIVESGAHRLSDGTSMFASTLATNSDGSGRVPIYEPDSIDDEEEIDAIFDDIMVFADSQTYDDSEHIVIRMKDVSSSGFQVKLQELEGSNGYHANEVIGYIAFDKTSELFSATHVRTTHVATTAQDISITNATRLPVFADMQSYNGSDSSMVSLQSSGSSSVDGKVYIDEETTRDSETAHTTETVAVAQFLGATVRTSS